MWFFLLKKKMNALNLRINQINTESVTVIIL